MKDEKDNDIELLAGQVWEAPARPPLVIHESTPNTPAGRPDWAQRALIEAARFLKPQAQVVRHTIRPEQSELVDLPPDYRDMLREKGGAG